MKYFRIFEVSNGICVQFKFITSSRRVAVQSHLPIWIARHFVGERPSAIATIILSSRELFEHIPSGSDALQFVSDAFTLANVDSIMPTLAY